MGYMTLGSITIEMKWLVMIVSLLLSYIIIRVSKKSGHQKILLELIIDSLILGVFILKGSLLIIDPFLVMKAPLSLLYFSGGELGFWLAVAVATYFYFRKADKKGIPFSEQMDLYFFYLFYSFTIFHLIYLFISPGWEHLLNFLIPSIVFIRIWIKRIPLPYFSFIVGFSFFQLVLANIFESKNDFFGYKFGFYSILILFLLFSKKTLEKKWNQAN